MGELHFITTSGNPGLVLKDPTSRRLIRTTATKATRSREVDELSEQHRTQSNTVQKNSQHGRMTRFRAKMKNSGISVDKDASPTTTLLTSPSRVQVPVWDPVVTPLGGQAWVLLHYYRYSFRAHSWAINAKEDWFAFVIEDQAATHATLSFVSLNRDLEEGSLISAPTLHHRARAIQLVRQQLSSIGSSVNDSVIGAIALLAITEGLEGHATPSALHYEALEKLVKLRGGLESLQSNRALSKLIEWASLCRTSTFSGQPRRSRLFLSSDLNMSHEGILSNNVKSSKFQADVQSTMFPKMYDLVRLLAAIPRCPPNDQTSLEERHCTGQLIYHMNQHVWSIYHDGPVFSADTAGQLAEVFCYATYLYITLVLRQMPKRTTIVIERAQKLHNSVRKLDGFLFCEPALEDLYLSIALWAHTLHFCSLLQHKQREFDTSQIKHIMRILRLKDVESLRGRLGEVHWVEGYAEDALQLLCDHSGS